MLSRGLNKCDGQLGQIARDSQRNLCCQHGSMMNNNDIYIYIYIYMCVCVCVCKATLLRDVNSKINTGEGRSSIKLLLTCRYPLMEKV